jgi:DNA-binding GntR family transcriptional regulator
MIVAKKWARAHCPRATSVWQLDQMGYGEAVSRKPCTWLRSLDLPHTPAADVKTNPRKPRYQALADDIRGKLMRGAYQDISFPTESVLCKTYGVSRFTVREALRALQSEGLIQRKRGAGTIIRPAAARGGALHQPLSNVAEILQYARDTQFEFAPLGLVKLPKALVDAIDVDALGRWFAFRGIRCTEGMGKPIARTDAYIHRDFAAIIDQIHPGDETIFRQIGRLSGRQVASVTQDIQAVSASRELADALSVAVRTPCLRILRCYFDSESRLMEISASHHPGDRFAYAMHIEVDT